MVQLVLERGLSEGCLLLISQRAFFVHLWSKGTRNQRARTSRILVAKEKGENLTERNKMDCVNMKWVKNIEIIQLLK